MLEKFRESSKSDFFRNTVILITGSSIAQAIPIAVSPILTRIYKPEDFGILAIFTSLTTVFSALVTARYELAILKPKEDEEGHRITTLSILIALMLSLFLFIIFSIFNLPISEFLGNPAIGPWLYFAPVVIFFAGIYNALKYYSIRKGNYKNIAKAGSIQSLTSVTIQLVAGLLKAGKAGLIFGNGIPFFISNGVLSSCYYADFKRTDRVSTISLRQLALKYVEFPKFSLLANIANILSQNLIVIFISSFFTSFVLGQYALVNRVLGMPSTIIGGAVADVFAKKALDERNINGNCIRTFKKTLKNLALLTVIIFVPAYFLVEPLFGFVFGKSWDIAGTYAKILVPLLAIRFLMSPLTMVFIVFEKKQVTALIWQFLFLIVSFTTFAITYYFKIDILNFLRIFTCSISLIYVLQFFILRKIANTRIVMS